MPRRPTVSRTAAITSADILILDILSGYTENWSCIIPGTVKNHKKILNAAQHILDNRAGMRKFKAVAVNNASYYKATATMDALDFFNSAQVKIYFDDACIDLMKGE